MVSINYVARFFIPFVPFLSILGALFVKEIIDLAKNIGWNFVPAVVAAPACCGYFLFHAAFGEHRPAFYE